MPYVGRDADGRVVALSETPMECGAEHLAADHPDVVAFLTRMTASQGDQFVASDLDFIRVIEDVIEALMRKGVLNLTDLPGSAQDKLMERRALRGLLAGVAGLFGDDGGKVG